MVDMTQGRLSGILEKKEFGTPMAELTPAALRVLEARYLAKDERGRVIEDPRRMFERVARAVASAESRWSGPAEAAREKAVETTARRFFELMSSLRFLPNSPTLMNAGRPKGQLSACFVLPIDDDLGGIFETLKESALIHQTGGGTGFSFGHLRPSGDIVRTSGGRASGPLGFLKIFDAATDTVRQGGTRRGANMAVLPVDHPDIAAFVESKVRGGISNFNISVGITDEFMAAVKSGSRWALRNPRDRSEAKTVKARALWNEIARAAWASGDPGVVFLDRINEANPTPELGEMESTNPCVTGDTRIWTQEKGLARIADLMGTTPEVATAVAGECRLCRAAQVIRTGVRPVYVLRTYEGYEIALTEDHRVRTEHGDIAARELTPGDRIELLERKAPKIDLSSADAGLGEIVGWLTGDGHFTLHEQGKPTAVLNFYGEDKQMAAPRLLSAVRRFIKDDRLRLCDVNSRDLGYIRSSRLRVALREIGIDDSCKKKVPEAVWRGSADLVSGYLRGLFSADGSVQGAIEKGVGVRLASIEPELLRDIQVLLLHLGIRSTLYRNRRVEGMRLLPDSKRRLREYHCAAQHELIVSRASLKVFAAVVGFLLESKTKALQEALSEYTRGPYKSDFYATVKELEFKGEEEVYDLTEPISQHFFANGLLVHNCGEQPLLPYESCNLGSVNLLAYARGDDLDWDELERDIPDCIRFLDDVVEANAYPLAEVEEITRTNRKIGLGVMGWADVLMEWGIPYDSERAVARAEQVMGRISRVAIAASERLAAEREPFPSFAKSLWGMRGDRPRRNATVTTVAPTGTISIIAGVSSGIEPVFSLAYERGALDGELLIFIHPALKRALREAGISSRRVLTRVLEAGSVAGVAELSSRARRALRTATEIKPEWHVRMQAAFQKFTENGVSKTINLPESATAIDVRRIYEKAYALGCKGITVFREASKGTAVLRRGISRRSGHGKDLVRVIDWLLDDGGDTQGVRKRASIGMASLSRTELKRQKR